MDKSIVLYSKEGCPSCKSLKMMLNKARVKYTENNSLEEMTALGFVGLPVLSVDGTYLQYADAKKWILTNMQEGN